MEEDFYDGEFADGAKVLIYDFNEGPAQSLVKSFTRLQELVNNLPASEIRTIWLYDRYESGLRLGMYHWQLGEDETDESFETLKIESNIKDFGELQRLQIKCRTECSDGDLAKLLDIVIKEIEKNKWSKLVELSFSNVGGDNLTEKVDFRLYFTKAE